MKKRLCRILSIAISLSCLFAGTNSLSVHAYNGRAYSIGCVYGASGNNLDTSQAVIQAANYYSLTGYASYYNTEPTYSYINSNRIQSDIVLFDGHGNYRQMQFISLDRGGDYHCGIDYGTGFYGQNGCHYVGLQNYSFSNAVRLMIFAGCETAKGDDNLPSRAVYWSGANASIGWQEVIYQVDCQKWLSRMSDYLSRGYEIYQAMDYADSFSDYYSNASIKSHIIWGDWHQVLKRAKSLRAEPTDGRIFSASLEMPANKLNLSSIESAIQTHDAAFSLQDYSITVTENQKGDDQKFIVDLNRKIGDFVTDSGYTIIFRNNKAIQVYNNSKSLPLTRAAIPSASQNAQAQALEKARQSFLQNSSLSSNDILSEEVSCKYDTATGTPYYLVMITYGIAEGDTILKNTATYSYNTN